MKPGNGIDQRERDRRAGRNVDGQLITGHSRQPLRSHEQSFAEPKGILSVVVGKREDMKDSPRLTVTVTDTIPFFKEELR